MDARYSWSMLILTAVCDVAVLYHNFLTTRQVWVWHLFSVQSPLAWMCSVSTEEGTFSPWDAGRKADCSRLVLSPFWNKPQCILSAMRCVAFSGFDVEQFIAAAHLCSCVWHKCWALVVLQLSGCPLGENPVLELCSLLCPNSTSKTYFLFFLFFHLEIRPFAVPTAQLQLLWSVKIRPS